MFASFPSTLRFFAERNFDCDLDERPLRWGLIDAPAAASKSRGEFAKPAPGALAQDARMLAVVPNEGGRVERMTVEEYAHRAAKIQDEVYVWDISPDYVDRTVLHTLALVASAADIEWLTQRGDGCAALVDAVEDVQAVASKGAGAYDRAVERVRYMVQMTHLFGTLEEYVPGRACWVPFEDARDATRRKGTGSQWTDALPAQVVYAVWQSIMDCRSGVKRFVSHLLAGTLPALPDGTALAGMHAVEERHKRAWRALCGLVVV